MDYKQTTVVGTSYQRSHKGSFNNPIGGTPGIYFGEEKIINLGDEVIHQEAGGITKLMNNPLATFPLVNPETNEPTGTTASYLDVYVILHSLYIAAAKDRDLSAAI